MTTSPDIDPFAIAYAERASLPTLLKPLHLFMTGLPGRDAQPRASGPLREVTRDLLLLLLFAATAAGAATYAAGGGFATLAAIPALYASLAIAGRLRKLTVGHMHEAGHGVGFAGWEARGWSRPTRRRGRFWLAEICSVTALTVSAAYYMRKHGQHHRLDLLGTVREPDGEDLAEQGFVRGMAPGTFGRRLIARLLSPAWYVRRDLKRLAQTLTQGKPVRRVAAASWLALLLGAAFVMPPVAWLAAIGLPWFVWYPAASLLQVLTEHPYGDSQGADSLAAYAARTWDRLPWDAWPQATGNRAHDLALRLRWTLRFALIHLPSRITVLDRTMVWHRWHHIAWPLGRPFDAWWTIGYAARDAWAEGILPKGWEANALAGLPAALDRQREHMESLA
jgi:hypothetical protein